MPPLRDNVDRIYRLEMAMVRLTDALLRWGTERDGAWGHEECRKAFGQIRDEILNNK